MGSSARIPTYLARLGWLGWLMACPTQNEFNLKEKKERDADTIENEIFGTPNLAGGKKLQRQH